MFAKETLSIIFHDRESVFTIKYYVEILRPVDEVVSFISNPNNIPQWRPDVLEGRSPGEHVASGTTFDELVNFLGGKMYTMKVIEYQLNHFVVYQAIEGPNVCLI